jgi:hypothetical protein
MSYSNDPEWDNTEFERLLTDIQSSGYAKMSNLPPMGKISSLGSYAMQAAAQNYITGSSIGTSQYAPTHPNYVISAPNRKEIVSITNDGKVVWADGIEIDEAAEALSKAIRLSSEMSAGITKRVRNDIRDTIFEEIISIAKKRVTLTADDLTLMLESSKIMDKLKGL